MRLNNRYEIDTFNRISLGKCSQIFPCVDLENKNLNLIAKVISFNDIEKAKREYEIQNSLQKFNNPHILKCYAQYSHENRLVIITERCELGDLSSKIKDMKNTQQRFNASQILDFLAQIVDGSYLLFQNHIFYRDMKPQNIFMKKDNNNNILYIIGDFGSSRYLENMNQEDHYTSWFTPRYQSPELLNKEPFSPLSDIFSFGLVLYEFCFLELPFAVNINNSQIKNIQQENYYNELKKGKVNINMKNIKGEEKELQFIQFILENTIVYDKQKRLNWDHIYQLVTKFKQSIQEVQIKQEHYYIIAKQHVHLLMSKKELVTNLLNKYISCFEGKTIQIAQDIYRLSFTILICCKYILHQCISAFEQSDYKKLSQNMKNILNKENFFQLSQNYKESCLQQSLVLLQCNQSNIENDDYTEGMVNQVIKQIQDNPNAQQNQLKKQKDLLIKMINYLKNPDNELDYEEFLYLSNEIYTYMIEPKIPDNSEGNNQILLALWRNYASSEIIYPQSNCNKIKDQNLEIQTNFTKEEAIYYLQNCCY